MPHEGYVDPIMNDGPGFHLDMPVSKLTECVTKPLRQVMLAQLLQLWKP